MATTIVTPGADTGSGSTSFEEALDNVLDTDSAESEESNTGDEGGDEEHGEEPKTKSTTDEEDVEETLEIDLEDLKGEEAESKSTDKPKLDDELEDELSQDEEIKPDREDEKEFHYKKAKAIRLMQAHADMQKIRDKIPAPEATLEKLEEHYNSHVAHTRMLEDFDSGFQGMKSVLNYLVGNPEKPETITQINPESVQVLAASLPYHLSRTHPKALGVLENVILDSYANALESGTIETRKSPIEQKVHGALVRELFQEAKDMENRGAGKDEVEQAYILAQRVSQRLLGTTEAGTPKSEPTANDQKLREAEEENRRLRQGQETHQRAIVQQRINAIEQDTTAADNEVIESILGKVEEIKRVKFTAKSRRHIVRDLQEAIDAGVRGNERWMNQFDTQRRAAVRKFSEESRNSLKASRRQFAEPIVRRNVREIVAEHVQSAVSASKRTHERQQKTQDMKEASPSGQPTSRKVDVRKAMNEGKLTYSELVDRVVG